MAVVVGAGNFWRGAQHGGPMDPATADNTYDQFVLNTMHNHLTEVDDEGNAVPDLAELIDATPDAKTWTVQVPSGIPFHNGKELDAEDIVHAILGGGREQAVRDEVVRLLLGVRTPGHVLDDFGIGAVRVYRVEVPLGDLPQNQALGLEQRDHVSAQ